MTRVEVNRYLPALAVAISLALTSLTISAVYQLTQTLAESERRDAREAAGREVAKRRDAFLADLETSFDGAEAALRSGEEATDAWITAQDFWSFCCVISEQGETSAHPLTPTEAPFPFDPYDASADFEAVEPSGESAAQIISTLQRAAVVAPTSQAGAAYAHLLTAASLRRLAATTGDRTTFAAAAVEYEHAADIMPTARRSLRGVFGARLAAADCFWQSNDRVRAAKLLLQLCANLANAHPAAWGDGELMLLRQRAAALPEESAERDELMGRLADLTLRSQTRSVLPEVMERATAALQAASKSDVTARPEFAIADDGDGAYLVAVRRRAAGGAVVLSASLDAVIGRYWRGDARWWVMPREELGGAEPFYVLPECFGELALEPSSQTLDKLRRSARRRLTVLAMVTGGLPGAWGVVIWLMVRGLRRQRELVELQQRFVADISHELKTPLALIRLSAETLTAGRVRREERVKEYHQTIARESERLTLLLDNILDFSRIELHGKRYDFTMCDVREVAEQAWSLFAPRLAAEHFALEFDIEHGLPLLYADPQAVEQVIVNLLQNARRYSDETKWVRLNVHRETDEIVISVSDRGIGMTKAQIRTLGRSFQRGFAPLVRKSRGAGLGLAIIKHIVEAHHGDLEVQSQVGYGSTFTVRLPVGPETPPE